MRHLRMNPNPLVLPAFLVPFIDGTNWTILSETLLTRYSPELLNSFFAQLPADDATTSLFEELNIGIQASEPPISVTEGVSGLDSLLVMIDIFKASQQVSTPPSTPPPSEDGNRLKKMPIPILSILPKKEDEEKSNIKSYAVVAGSFVGLALLLRQIHKG